MLQRKDTDSEPSREEANRSGSRRIALPLRSPSGAMQITFALPRNDVLQHTWTIANHGTHLSLGPKLPLMLAHIDLVGHKDIVDCSLG